MSAVSRRRISILLVPTILISFKGGTHELPALSRALIHVQGWYVIPWARSSLLRFGTSPSCVNDKNAVYEGVVRLAPGSNGMLRHQTARQ